MGYKELDMAAYKRRAHFDYFRSLAYPYAGVTVEIDISRLVPTLKAHGLPFFLPVLYCAVRAANSVPEFRQRTAQYSTGRKNGRLCIFSVGTRREMSTSTVTPAYGYASDLK